MENNLLSINLGGNKCWGSERELQHIVKPERSAWFMLLAI